MSVAWLGKYIEVVVDEPWEYVRRTRGIGAAVILATTDSGEVVLVEQHRVPLGRRCIELPAGLIGDEDEGADALSTAKRELEEETGFVAREWREIGHFASSPGMMAEGFQLFRATGLDRVGEGGGTGAHEDIVVHLVPRSELAAFVAAKRTDGCAIDAKLLGVLQIV